MTIREENVVIKQRHKTKKHTNEKKNITTEEARLLSLKQEHEDNWCSWLMLRATLPPGGNIEKLTLLTQLSCVLSGKRRRNRAVGQVQTCNTYFNCPKQTLVSKLWWVQSYNNTPFNQAHCCLQINDSRQPPHTKTHMLSAMPPVCLLVHPRPL